MVVDYETTLYFLCVRILLIHILNALFGCHLTFLMYITTSMSCFSSLDIVYFTYFPLFHAFMVYTFDIALI